MKRIDAMTTDDLKIIRGLKNVNAQDVRDDNLQDAHVMRHMQLNPQVRGFWPEGAEQMPARQRGAYWHN